MTISSERIDGFRQRIPRQGRMRVDGIVYADRRLWPDLADDPALEQVANVACLPGIVGASLAMPDIHWGYGFPIGGVAAFDLDDGVVSPGGVGYDINCGVRLLATGLPEDEVRPRARALVEALYRNIPSGVGSERRDLKLGNDDLRRIQSDGAAWAVARGLGLPDDLERSESGGCIDGADPGAVSARAVERGRSQVGTVGSGNHFVEVASVSEVYDAEVATAFGLARGDVTVMIHSGSRGFGYQVCDDALGEMLKASARHGIELPDRQLCAAPFRSEEARRYLGAMRAAANFAFVNRQVMAHDARRTLADLFAVDPTSIRQVYDVAHNIAKVERHEVDGRTRELCVHRKGATRALPAGHPELPAAWRAIGQPVIVPGDMGRASYVLVGTEKAARETFASCCHGAGRKLSRKAATRAAKGRSILREMEDIGVLVRAAGRATVVEEMPEAYKDIEDVVNVVDGAGLARKVVKLKPFAVVKG